MEQQLSSAEHLASMVLGGVFFIESDINRKLKDATDLFSAGMDFTRISKEEITRIKNEEKPSAPKTYIEFARIPVDVNVEEVRKKFLGNPDELILNYHEIIAFCEKYREWFKKHIRIGYFFTLDGFAIVRSPYCTDELSFDFFKMNELHDLGVGLRSSLAFIIKVDWDKFVPH